MQLCLFDTNSNRRLVWRRTCQKYSIELQCFESLATLMDDPPPHSRLLVFDSSVVGDCFQAATGLVTRFRQDIVGFMLVGANCSKAMRLIELGARWLFDDAIAPTGTRPGPARIMQIVAEHDMKLHQFRTLQSMFATLTSGENEVLRLILAGMHNNQIAADLGISIRTVESRRANAYRKTNAASLAELSRRYYQFEALSQIFRAALPASPPSHLSDT